MKLLSLCALALTLAAIPSEAQMMRQPGGPATGDEKDRIKGVAGFGGHLANVTEFVGHQYRENYPNGAGRWASFTSAGSCTFDEDANGKAEWMYFVDGGQSMIRNVSLATAMTADWVGRRGGGSLSSGTSGMTAQNFWNNTRFSNLKKIQSFGALTNKPVVIADSSAMYYVPSPTGGAVENLVGASLSWTTTTVTATTSVTTISKYCGNFADCLTNVLTHSFAVLNNVVSFAVDGDTMYLAESTQIDTVGTWNSRASQTYKVVAGYSSGNYVDGFGLDVRFSQIKHIAYASQPFASILVTDSNAGTLRVMKISDSNVTTLAGVPGVGGRIDGPRGIAQFSSPSDMVVKTWSTTTMADKSFVFVADGSRIRKVQLSTGTMVTVFGRGGEGFQVNMGPLTASIGTIGGLCMYDNTLFIAAGHVVLRAQANATSMPEEKIDLFGDRSSASGAALSALVAAAVAAFAL